MKRTHLWIVYLLAMALRLIGMDLPNLWYDENFTLILARLPFDQMIAATAGDVHPPLWYAIEWTWIHLSPDPMAVPAWALRIPAMGFSLMAFIVFAAILDEFKIPSRIQAAALGLMAILPMQIWYAQEARMYSLLEFEVLFALYCALRVNWIGLFLASLAMLYTQNYAVFYIAALWLWMARGEIEFHRHAGFFSPVGLKISTALIAAFVLFIPWVIVIVKQMSTISGRYWIQPSTFGDVANTIYKLFFTSSMPSFGLLPALLVVFMAVGLGAFHLAQSNHPDKVAILIFAFAPLVMAWTVSVVWQPILLFRPLIGIAPFLYLVAAWPVEQIFAQVQIKSWREASIAGALAIPILVSGLGGYYRNIPAMKSDGAVSPLIDALAYVRSHWQPGDVIYYTDDGPMINLSPYANDLPQFEMAACGDRLNTGPVLGSLSAGTRSAIGIPVRPLEEIPHRRAWVFAPRSPLHPICYEKQIAPYTPGDPLIVVDDNEFIFSGVWLVER